MPRQEILSPTQHDQLSMLPADARQISDCYTFSPADLDLIACRRGEPNRLGFAIQLGFLRHPGRVDAGRIGARSHAPIHRRPGRDRSRPDGRVRRTR